MIGSCLAVVAGCVGILHERIVEGIVIEIHGDGNRPAKGIRGLHVGIGSRRLSGIFVIVHDLRHGRGHTADHCASHQFARGIIFQRTEVVVGFHLSPNATEHLRNMIGKGVGVGRHAPEGNSGGHNILGRFLHCGQPPFQSGIGIGWAEG